MIYFLRNLKAIKALRARLKYQSATKALAVLFLILFSAHTAAMMMLEGWSLEIALWFTVTAGTTVGFGDFSPATTWGRLATVFLIYVPLIPTVALLTGRFVEKIISRREKKLKGNWRWNMSDHIVFINFPNQGGSAYFTRILHELKSSCSLGYERDIIIVTDSQPDGLPHELINKGVKLVTGRPNDETTLKKASVYDADSIIILCESASAPSSDSLILDIASLLQDSAPNGNCPPIIAEAITESTKTRLKKLGVQSVIRPIRAYPELLARTILSPGSEQIIENLFNSSDEECLKFPCKFEGAWSDLVITLITKGHGTPIAVEAIDGTIRANLIGSDEISIKSVFMIVPNGKSRNTTYFEDDLLKSA